MFCKHMIEEFSFKFTILFKLKLKSEGAEQ